MKEWRVLEELSEEENTDDEGSEDDERSESHESTYSESGPEIFRTICNDCGMEPEDCEGPLRDWKPKLMVLGSGELQAHALGSYPY